MEPVINFSHVTKEYPLYHHIGSGIKDLVFHHKRAFQLLKGRKYLAIEDITFTVGKGEAVALIGRNGAGKSTSLGLVAGVLAGVGATGIGWALAHFVFKLPYVSSVLPLLAGAVAGCAVVTLAGWLGTRHLLYRPPLASLRALN